MSTERSIEQLVADALQQGAPASAPKSLVTDVIGEARGVRRRPRWFALLTERPMARPPTVLVGSPALRTASVILALILTVLVGGLALFAGGLLPRPELAVVVPTATVVPTPTDRPAPTASFTPAPTQARRAGLVAYTVIKQRTPCDRPLKGQCAFSEIWLANADGSDPRLLSPDDPSGEMLGWSADGSRLLYDGSDGLTVTDASRTHQQVIDPKVLCAHAQKGDPPDPNVCTGADGFALSPDATRIAFVRDYARARRATVVAILDLATGAVRELAATRATNGSEQCWKSTSCQGVDETPRWSPDGRRLVFARQVMSPDVGGDWTTAALYAIGADGSGMQRLTPSGMYAYEPSWSADGTTIAFINAQMVVNASRTSVTDMLYDVYTIGSDGTGMRRLTDDGASFGPRWTTTGRLNFVRGDWNWVMDTDGSDATRLDFDLAALTAAGCTTCRYPGPGQGVGSAWWQPVPGG